ncbi:MAG: glycoside hydrolase family 127 protein [Prevotella sp.]|nr:glycoside hydrolase family 127 protein [Prevotella sp.]
MKRQLKRNALATCALLMASATAAAQGGVTNTSKCENARMTSIPLSAVQWTGGFWGERFGVLSKTSVQSMWQTWQSPQGKGFNNFLVAAGEKQGEHHGPPFHDGDMYKWLEAVASVYAITRDPQLEQIMDRFIALVQKSQRADGYIHTPVIIRERSTATAPVGFADGGGPVGTATGTKNDAAFANRLNFETYNLGHLIMAGIIHKRATGKTTLFDCGVRAADFLYDFCQRAPEELAGNAICPSHYMGVAELYRETGNKKYLDLLRQFIDIRGLVKNGTDDNQDRIPFRQQYRAMGHAVRANYLYAGVADLYLESGEEQLMKNLTSIWTDIVSRKMYVNGACGALYDGTSPDGTNYTPDSIQKVHQSYGRPYQLPQSTAHNETCANIGNMLFNWRMLLATADAKYMDLMENCLYNSILPGISLDGESYFYTNPLRISDELPYKLRWPKERKKYISCFCCPPNTLRTLCQAQDYAYTLTRPQNAAKETSGTIYVNLFGQSRLQGKLAGVGDIVLNQQSDYPWSGHVTLTIEKLKTPRRHKFAIALRCPDWAAKASYTVNGMEQPVNQDQGYAVVEREWKQGDVITFDLPMETRIVEANPLVEESRGQVAVMRGPILYCLESTDLNGGTDIDNVVIPVAAQFRPVWVTIGGSRMMALETEACVRSEAEWTGTLYRPAASAKTRQTVRLIPYYAWGNRGKSEMTVWMPVDY